MSHIYDVFKNYELTHEDPASWIALLWGVLDHYNDTLTYEGDLDTDVWDDVCTAMAWIQEELDVVTKQDEETS